VDLLAPLVMARHAMKKNTAKAVARLTGEYDVFASRKAFEEQMIDFTNRMHSRYMLSFEPRRPHPGLHRIRVRLKEPRGNVSVIFSSDLLGGRRRYPAGAVKIAIPGRHQ
jgi:hypothetical protein